MFQTRVQPFGCPLCPYAIINHNQLIRICTHDAKRFKFHQFFLTKGKAQSLLKKEPFLQFWGRLWIGYAYAPPMLNKRVCVCPSYVVKYSDIMLVRSIDLIDKNYLLCALRLLILVCTSTHCSYCIRIPYYAWCFINHKYIMRCWGIIKVLKLHIWLESSQSVVITD